MPIEGEPLDAYNPCNQTDAGNHINCLSSTEGVCLPFDGAFNESGYPQSIAIQLYPPLLNGSYVNYIEETQGSTEYFPGTPYDRTGRPPSPGPFPSFVVRTYTDPVTKNVVTHYFADIQYTKNIDDHAPGTGIDWDLYWAFACSRCQESICRPGSLECVDLDASIRIAPNGAPVCSTICGDASLEKTDAEGLWSCSPSI